MKTILFVIFSLSLMTACKKTDRSMLNTPCQDSCTTVQGRFITGNNEGIANVDFEIRSEIKPTSGLGQATIRKIATGKTDNNGFYTATFSLQKGEYGETGDANVLIRFDYDKTRFVPVTWYENFGANELLGPFTRKDTTVTADIYLTSRSKIRVKLENFVPVQTGDNFSIITTCGAGLERRYTSGGHIEANQPVTEGEIDACGNEQTTVIIRKRKNGISSSSSSTIFTPTGQTATVTFSY